MTTTVVRGAAVHISVIFRDEDGVAISPSAASMKLRYRVHRRMTNETLTLTDDGDDNWIAVWDSSVADAGSVEWWAQSADSPKAACQGNFYITANRANPTP